MLPVWTREQARAWDAHWIDVHGVPGSLLMENAGAGAATWLRQWAGATGDAPGLVSPEAWMLAGSGNNAGDAFVLARHLLGEGWRVRVVLCAPGAETALRGDASMAWSQLVAAYAVLRSSGVSTFEAYALADASCHVASPPADHADHADQGVEEASDRDAHPIVAPLTLDALGVDLSRADVVVDALFGTGLNRPVEGWAEALIAWLASRVGPGAGSGAGGGGGMSRGAWVAPSGLPRVEGRRRPLLVSLDLPSGLCANTGRPLHVAVMAEQTLAFGAPKVGVLQMPGILHAGQLHTVSLGFPVVLGQPGHGVFVGSVCSGKDEHRRASAALRPVTHKGEAGRVGVVAGSEHSPGAATLACLGALRMGAGLVKLVSAPAVLVHVLGHVPEVMTTPLDIRTGPAEALRQHRTHAALIGPGLGATPAWDDFYTRCLTALPMPLVVDADALGALARRGLDTLAGVSALRVLTPHPREAARLLRCSVDEIQADRWGAVQAIARQCNQCVVLKGAGTLVAVPDDEVGPCIASGHHPALATGGTGDLLAGMLVAVLAGDVANGQLGQPQAEDDQTRRSTRLATGGTSHTTDWARVRNLVAWTVRAHADAAVRAEGMHRAPRGVLVREIADCVRVFHP